MLLIICGEVAVGGGKILPVYKIFEMTANKNLGFRGTHHGSKHIGVGLRSSSACGTT